MNFQHFNYNLLVIHKTTNIENIFIGLSTFIQSGLFTAEVGLIHCFINLR